MESLGRAVRPSKQYQPPPVKGVHRAVAYKKARERRVEDMVARFARGEDLWGDSHEPERRPQAKGERGEEGVVRAA